MSDLRSLELQVRKLSQPSRTTRALIEAKHTLYTYQYDRTQNPHACDSQALSGIERSAVAYRVFIQAF